MGFSSDKPRRLLAQGHSRTKADLNERGETTCSPLAAVWDLLCAALSYLVSGSGEHLIPNSLMTQHFPHHLTSSMAEGSNLAAAIIPPINNKSPGVWIIKNATLLFLHSHRNTRSTVGFPLSCCHQATVEKEKGGH